MARWRVAGINFDHMHMGDLLREVAAHPEAEIAGLCDRDPSRMKAAIETFGVPGERVFTDVRACLEACRPDLVMLCPATAHHAAAVEEVAPFGADILMEKPFAASLADAADRRGHDRRRPRGPLLRRQPRAALPPRRQGRGVGGGGAPRRRPVEYVLHCKATGNPIEGPLGPSLCRTAQRIVDTAVLSAQRRQTLALID